MATGIENELEEAGDDVEKLRKLVRDKDKQITEQNDAITSITALYEAERNKNKKLQEDVNKLTDDLKKCREELKKCKARQEELEKELEKCKKDKEDLEKELKKCQDRQKELEKELEKCKEEVKKCKEGSEELEKCKERQKELEKELEKCKKDKEDLEKELEKCKDRQKELEKELEKCKKEKEELEKELKKCQDKQKELEKELEKCQERQKELEKELEKCQEEAKKKNPCGKWIPGEYKWMPAGSKMPEGWVKVDLKEGYTLIQGNKNGTSSGELKSHWHYHGSRWYSWNVKQIWYNTVAGGNGFNGRLFPNTEPGNANCAPNTENYGENLKADQKDNLAAGIFAELWQFQGSENCK